MGVMGARSTRLLALASGIAAIAFALSMWFQGRRTSDVVPSVTYQLEPRNMNQWTSFGGRWEIVDGAVKSNSFERGAKLLAGSSHWSNYTLNTDIWFDGPAADMGVVIRTNDEAEGVDAYNGYFVGLRSLDGTLVLGRANYAWIEVLPVTIPGGIRPSNWYRLRVTAYGCHIASSVTNLATGQTAWIAFHENWCVKSGRFGLRTLNANAKWRNINIVVPEKVAFRHIQVKYEVCPSLAEPESRPRCASGSAEKCAKKL
jgi:hypothetical protein